MLKKKTPSGNGGGANSCVDSSSPGTLAKDLAGKSDMTDTSFGNTLSPILIEGSYSVGRNKIFSFSFNTPEYIAGFTPTNKIQINYTGLSGLGPSGTDMNIRYTLVAYDKDSGKRIASNCEDKIESDLQPELLNFSALLTKK